MASQYVFTMNRVSKMVEGQRFILKDISLSFFPGAKIGVLGLNGSVKLTWMLKPLIMYYFLVKNGLAQK